MTNRLATSLLALTLTICLVPLLQAQTAAAPSLPAASNAGSSKAPDLSGDWALDNKKGGIGQSISLSDPGGKLRGKEPDIPYQPWALAKTLSEFPPTGPDTQYDKTTDPYIKYCEPLGIGRIY